MANTLYNNARQLFLSGQIDWRTATIKCCLVNTTSGNYAFSPTHTVFSSVSGTPSNIVGGPTKIKQLTWPGGNLPVTDGAADAEDVTFNQITGDGEPVGAIIIYQDLGTGDTGAPLIAYIDTATGLPITPNGGDIIVTWDNGVNKIFRL